MSKELKLDPGPNVAADVNSGDWFYVAAGPSGETYVRYKGQWWISYTLRWSQVLCAPSQDWLNEILDTIVGKTDPLAFAPTDLGDDWVDEMVGAGVGVVYLASVTERVREYLEGVARAIGAAAIDQPTPYELKIPEARTEVFWKGHARRHFTTDGGIIRKRWDGNWDEKIQRGSSPECEWALVVSQHSARRRQALGIKKVNDMTANVIEAANVLNLPQAKLYNQCFGMSRGFLVMRGNKLPLDTRSTITVSRNGKPVETEPKAMMLKDLQHPFADIIEFVTREQDLGGPLVIATGTGIGPIWVNRGDLVTIDSNNGINGFTQTVVQDDPPAEFTADDPGWLLKQVQAQQAALAA